jgi:hypothetical protein
MENYVDGKDTWVIMYKRQKGYDHFYAAVVTLRSINFLLSSQLKSMGDMY